MKKLTIALLLLVSTHLVAGELAWVDEQIEAIKPPRKGISIKDISKLKDPFIFLHAKKAKKRVRSPYRRYSKSSSGKRKVQTYSSKLQLEAILNKTALINGRWYKEGEKVYGYKLEKVNLQSVLLTQGKKQILLSTVSKSKNLKFNNK
ncbi:hypothetical protein [Sulfurimonas paralvinellae]|uniref:Uncharacterized protein n=1 Tax=Sulfurimonas paralvinellae TaxID=317658 RepID=A0A7M1B6Q1_9BACT|nr:hypothetical protein [Sulfurimonas paralvinellae]QOP45419.1 hypothetical protein FM071_03645 [Sulfurimonas paralvinellae]